MGYRRQTSQATAYKNTTAGASTPVSTTVNADLLLVAGGAGGGGTSIGGGGAGGVISVYNVILPKGNTFTVTVGGGGVGAFGSGVATNGQDSAFIGPAFTNANYFVIGGGAPWQPYNSSAGFTRGGCGGGSNYNSTDTSTNQRFTVGRGIPGQGYDGGYSISPSNSSGGGGGAGGAAQAGGAIQGSGPGGPGVFNDITGNAWYWGGGGGGCGGSGLGAGSSGGVGGGGAGGGTNAIGPGGGSALNAGGNGGSAGGSLGPGGAGGSNTGGGGGSGRNTGGATRDGGAGGSGIVVVRVPSSVTPSSIIGSYTLYTPTGYKAYAFLSSGSITF